MEKTFVFQIFSLKIKIFKLFGTNGFQSGKKKDNECVKE